VDGTGAVPRVADVAVTGGEITAVGTDLRLRGRREVDCHGLVVAPGWVDAHTHFDGQVTWDPYLTPSSAGGVTTCIMGNCGIGFAPCQATMRNFLVDLMDAVEDIPGSALHEGIRWEWETFPEYLASLERQPLACDVGVLIAHAPVRTWVLGRRANLSDRPGGPEKDPVTPEEMARMAQVVEEAVAAGALGFSTSRQLLHRDKSGVLEPGALASTEEMLAIGAGLVRGGGGCFQLADDFSTYDDIAPQKRDQERTREHHQREWAWITELASKNPEALLLTTGVGTGMTKESAGHHRYMLRRLEKIAKLGGRISGQVMTRLGGIHYCLAAGNHPFLASQSYRRLWKEKRDDIPSLVQRMAEPATKAAILKEAREAAKNNSHPAAGILLDMMHNAGTTWPWSQDYEPKEEDSLSGRAQRDQRSKLEVCYDLLVQTDAPHGGVLWRPLFNYGSGDLEPVREMMCHEQVVPGFADAGAHVRFVCDATSATHLLTYWARDRARGQQLPLEMVVKKHTQDTAAIIGLSDRGVLQPGKKADLNLIDLEALQLQKPQWVNDLPLGAGRWVQAVEGYKLTLVSGEVTYEEGKPTGVLPGRLVKNPRSVGLQGSLRGTVPAAVDEPGQSPADDVDLTSHALELSKQQGAGASAVGRVFKSVAEPGPAAPPQSRL